MVYNYALFSFQGTINCELNIYEKCGGNTGKATPDPISNSVVKLTKADDTWLEAAWESRTSPLFS